ncbi:MAG: glycosyltransferase [Planctomycetes bacterium]|nr:glycosyltransferase [Planctomycetota bacterium]
MTQFDSILTWTQLVLLAPLAILGLHRGWMAWLCLRSRHLPATPPPPADWPRVTVQLPIFNERFVAARLIEAVAALDYPRDRLEIQVLDDSTDDTCEIVQRTLRDLPADLDIAHIRRGNRTGFKAGALAAGLAKAKGEFLAVFDADFVPEPDFLRRTVPFFADPRVGMVQARWEHINPDSRLLTRMQALLLDGHFAVEHVGRQSRGCFFNFNGTAGVFRRAAIVDAGGWQHDTLTEDMDLSYRAQLQGWRFVYRPDIACAAELPVEMRAFLNQQHRWAKGSVQTGRKLLPRILRAPIPVVAKIEAVFHLLGNVGFVLLLGVILIGLPLQIVRLNLPLQMPWLVGFLEGLPLIFATGSVLVYYGLSQARLSRLDLFVLPRLPVLLALAAGMCINNTAAVCSAFGRDPGEFTRTPKLDIRKGGNAPQPHALGFLYHSKRGFLPLLELGLGAYALATTTLAASQGHWLTAFYHLLFASGLIWVGGESMARASVAAQPEPVRGEPSSAHS